MSSCASSSPSSHEHLPTSTLEALIGITIVLVCVNARVVFKKKSIPGHKKASVCSVPVNQNQDTEWQPLHSGLQPVASGSPIMCPFFCAQRLAHSPGICTVWCLVAMQNSLYMYMYIPPHVHACVRVLYINSDTYR